MTDWRRIRLSLVLTATMALCGSVIWAAEGIISKSPDSAGEFCHLRFPAIREDSLFTDRPVLKDPSEGDIIDFYGPCNHDPLSRVEVLRQRADARRFRDHFDGETN